MFTLTYRELPPSHERQHELYLEWRAYLPRWPWEWLCTLPVREGIDYFRACEIFRVWRRRLIREEELQLGFYIISRSKMKVLHFHLLAFGRNRDGKTLRDVSISKWRACWLFPIKAKIEEVYDREGAANYFAKNILGFLADHAQIDSFNRKLLAKTLEVRRDGLDNFDGVMAERGGPGIGSPDDPVMLMSLADL